MGNTHTHRSYFSFLNSDKFLKGKVADKFKAKITWERDGQSEEILLSESPKTEQPELVRFIPQSYFEELTNETEISKFQGVLQKIIFDYIPNAEKLEKSTFHELEKFKTGNVNSEIITLKNSIQSINRLIIELENKSNPGYLNKINGLIEEKVKEIDVQKKLLDDLPKLINPNNSEIKQDSNIVLKNNNLDSLKEQLIKKETERSNATIKIEALNQLKIKIEHQKRSFDDFLENNSDEAIKHNLKLADIIKIDTDYSSIDSLIFETQNELNTIAVFFETFDSIIHKSSQGDNQSLVYQIKILTDEIKIETDIINW